MRKLSPVATNNKNKMDLAIRKVVSVNIEDLHRLMYSKEILKKCH